MMSGVGRGQFEETMDGKFLQDKGGDIKGGGLASAVSV